MRLPLRCALLGAVLFVAGCQDGRSPVEPPGWKPLSTAPDVVPAVEDGADLLVDATPVHLKPPFAWLPPMAAESQRSGVFDPELAPVVEVCALVNGACEGDPIARFTTTSGPGSETIRVNPDPDGHYIVNWHTRRFNLPDGGVYRVRVLLWDGFEVGAMDVRIGSGGGGVGQPLTLQNGRTLPVKFWIQKVRRLTVIREAGVQGTPVEKDTLYAYGARVAYDYSAAPGHRNLMTLVDGEEAPASGVLVMDRQHLLMAAAEETPVLVPGDERLVQSARAILTASDKVAAFRTHLEQVAELYRQVGADEAHRRMQIVQKFAYDLEADSAAIRQAHEALGNHIFPVRFAPGALAARAPAPGLSAATAAMPTTEFWTVNGILVTPSDAADFASSVALVVGRAGVGSEVNFFYNRTFLYQSASEHKTGKCWWGIITDWDLKSVVLKIPRLIRCLALTVRDLIRFVADVGEAGRQVANAFAGFPARGVEDARLLGETMRTVLGRSDNMIVIPHSQGNLMVMEALDHMRSREPKLQTGAPSCVGVVSLAAPLSGSYVADAWPTVDRSVLKQIVVRGDIILMLGLNGRFPVDTKMSQRYDAILKGVKIGSWITAPFSGGWSLAVYKVTYLMLRGKLHLTSTYLSPDGAELDVRSALTANHRGLPKVAGCAPKDEVPSAGADVVVYNDINVFDNTGMGLADNVHMARNLVAYTGEGSRASGKTVWFDRGRRSTCAYTGECSDARLSTMRSTITGAGYSITNVSSSGGSLTSIPADVKALFLWMPLEHFTVAEINTLKQFAAEGGRVVFIGEWEGYYNWRGPGIAVENQFLLNMGAVMTNLGNAVDCGYNDLPAASLRPHQITTGMGGVRIACASVIRPGPGDYPLFYSRSGSQLLAGVAKIDTAPISGLQEVMGTASVWEGETPPTSTGG